MHTLSFPPKNKFTISKILSVRIPQAMLFMFWLLPSPSWAQDSAEILKQVKTDEFVESLASEFQQDPRFEVSVNDEGQIEVKKRTPPSPKQAPVNWQDPYETQFNQRIINFGGAFGVAGTVKGERGPENQNSRSAYLGATGEVGFRIPSKQLKRLLVGAAFSHQGNEYKDQPNYRETKGLHPDYSAFAEWDVLVLSNDWSEVTGLSVGPYIGEVSSTYGGESDRFREQGVQARLRWSTTQNSSKFGSSYYLLSRVSTQGVVRVYVGLSFMIGPKMKFPVKAIK